MCSTFIPELLILLLMAVKQNPMFTVSSTPQLPIPRPPSGDTMTGVMAIVFIMMSEVMKAGVYLGNYNVLIVHIG